MGLPTLTQHQLLPPRKSIMSQSNKSGTDPQAKPPLIRSRQHHALDETPPDSTPKVLNGFGNLTLPDSTPEQFSPTKLTGWRSAGGNKTIRPTNVRRLGSLEASDGLSVVQECLVGALLLLLMFMVYLFTRRFTAPKASGSTAMRIVRKKAPVMYKLL